MITSTLFRTDYPVFQETEQYPDSLINYWLQVSSLLLNQDRFGQPAPWTAQSVALNFGGTGYAINDTLQLAGGTWTTSPIVLTVSAVGVGGVITAVSVTNPGAYTIFPTNPVSQLSTSGSGTGATFNLKFTSAPYTEYDFATELFVAHNVVLDRKAQISAANGSLPGEMTGPVNSKSVGGISISYDVALAAFQGMGDWNLTIYGVRFARMVKLFGMGPLTIVGSPVPGWLQGPGWQGPNFAWGYDWDM